MAYVWPRGKLSAPPRTKSIGGHDRLGVYRRADAG